MPYFSENVDCEIHISPGEFIDKCNNKELEQLIDEVECTSLFMKRYYDRSEDDVDSRSYSHQEYSQHLTALRRAWYQVSKEDAEIIAILAKKYGLI